MNVTQAGFGGVAPKVLTQPVVKDAEQAKYEKAWSLPAYRDYAPGEGLAQIFLGLACPSPVDTVIDYGAGTGRGALMIALLGQCKVHMLDFAGNCLDEDVRNALTTQAHVLQFSKQDLRKPVPITARFGFCTDVMEHIEPQEVDRVLHHILHSAEHVFFQISTQPDHFGAEIGETLHLTVQPYEWWLEKFKEHDAVVQWAQKLPGVCAFYVTAWQSTRELIKHGELNVAHEEIKQHILSNMARGLPELRPHPQNDIPVMILAGGPSMNEYKDEIVKRRWAGEKLITVNGAYNWAYQNGMNPSAQIMVDSREFNKRFLEPTIKDCRYLLASQCHPASFDAVPAEQTVLWHSAIGEEMLTYLEELYLPKGQPWYPVLGGSTVMLRALPLMLMLGYNKYEIFGFDSCLMDDKHHSYDQPENDGQSVLQVLCNGRTFHCHPWMVSQAQEFLDLMRLMSEHIELSVRGDGLISWMIQTAAQMGDASLEVQQT